MATMLSVSVQPIPFRWTTISSPTFTSVADSGSAVRSVVRTVAAHARRDLVEPAQVVGDRVPELEASIGADCHRPHGFVVGDETGRGHARALHVVEEQFHRIAAR